MSINLNVVKIGTEFQVRYVKDNEHKLVKGPIGMVLDVISMDRPDLVQIVSKICYIKANQK